MTTPAAQLRVRWRCQSFVTAHMGTMGGPVAKAASTKRKRPGLTRRMVRSTLRVGMLATAVLVGRKTAGGRARDAQDSAGVPGTAERGDRFGGIGFLVG